MVIEEKTCTILAVAFLQQSTRGLPKQFMVTKRQGAMTI
jgi:hypothetical protein